MRYEILPFVQLLPGLNPFEEEKGETRPPSSGPTTPGHATSGAVETTEAAAPVSMKKPRNLGGSYYILVCVFKGCKATVGASSLSFGHVTSVPRCACAVANAQQPGATFPRAE